ncbi:MAG: signal transduction histidine kinase, partial [bacterium]
TLDLLQKTQKQLITQEKMASLGGLVAGVAHEINTPLGIAVTAASFLSQETKKIESLIEQSTLKKSDLIHFLKIDKDSSKIILANLRRAEELIRSFKQVAVDQTTQECRSFNIKSYMDEVLTSLHPKIRHTNVTVSVDCSESIELESFPGALSQIITNLVMNSLLHGYDRHEKGTIEFKVNQNSHNKVVFIYTDDGKGIPEENLNKIFDPFFTTKRGQGGTGLGLHIIYNIITQQLKGSILCESKVGNGTTFTITLPTSITKNSSTLNQITVD